MPLALPIPTSAAAADETIGLAKFIRVAAPDNDAIKTSFATSTSAQSYSGAALNGVIGGGEIPPYGRSLTVTTTAAPPNTYNIVDPLVFHVEDYTGATYDITVAVSSATAAATYENVGATAFRIVGVEVEPQGGVGGTFKIGVGDAAFSLNNKVKAEGFTAALLAHTIDGALANPGDVTINSPSVINPLGSAAFVTPPTGTDDRILFEIDPS